MKAKLFDSAIVSTPQEALDFIGNILESSTEYSIIGEDLDGRILLWNEGAHGLYGYESEEVLGIANSSMLHTPKEGEILCQAPSRTDEMGRGSRAARRGLCLFQTRGNAAGGTVCGRCAERSGKTVGHGLTRIHTDQAQDLLV